MMMMMMIRESCYNPSQFLTIFNDVYSFIVFAGQRKFVVQYINIHIRI